MQGFNSSLRGGGGVVRPTRSVPTVGAPILLVVYLGVRLRGLFFFAVGLKATGQLTLWLIMHTSITFSRFVFQYRTENNRTIDFLLITHTSITFSRFVFHDHIKNKRAIDSPIDYTCINHILCKTALMTCSLACVIALNFINLTCECYAYINHLLKLINLSWRWYA